MRIAKGDSMFCFPENIPAEANKPFSTLREQKFLVQMSADSFADNAAHFLANLNAIHVFREGNGRVQLVYLTVLADRAGHPLDFDRLDPQEMLTAMIESFAGDETKLQAALRNLLHLEDGIA